MFNKIQTLQVNTDMMWRLLFASFAAYLVMLIPDQAMALAAFDTRMCNVLNQTRGTPAKVIATLGIIFLGIGAFFGKLNWGTALLIAVGIISIFAAAEIVVFLGGNATCPVV